ncbi:hypothetical protein DYB38_009779 [Aphanomyces astaci]|uniref:Peptidase C51 domain-containing protein n=1 Tax=Aphanomyces astaci TaxID=112090 RepID=A0A397CMB0_APHAT|nr:hypothetical protein DYB38_009779 [Aphanomyces astaci]
MLLWLALHAAVTAAYLSPTGNRPAPWGTVLGVTNGVKVYSNYKAKVHNGDNYYQGTYTGLKWQCVELARRYLLITHGVVFESVVDAVEIFNLRSVKNVINQDRLPLNVYPQGSSTPPQVGSLLIWDRQGVNSPHGHVAVIVNVQNTYIDIAEENFEDTVWPPSANYSRRISVSRTPAAFNVKPYYNQYKASENVLEGVTFSP